ncbi:DUF3179 domain-containing protein [Patescibacteria group bacterium]|nr:DUF3179 domain-containing protein [Patescibacteria group bacterium]
MKKALTYAIPVISAVVVFGAIMIIRNNQMDKAMGGLWPTLDGGVYEQAVKVGKLQYLVPPNEVVDGGVQAEDLPALNEPTFGSIAAEDEKLADDVSGIVVTSGSEARFYSFQILNWHYAVNDVIGGKNVAVTYSPLSGSVAVYDRGDMQLQASAKLYNNIMLLTDGSDSLWNQLNGQRVVGESVGEVLVSQPFAVMTWASFKAAYPQGQALSTETGHVRAYGIHPYGSYDNASSVYFPLNHLDSSQPLKAIMHAVANGGTTVLVPDVQVFANNALNLEVGDLPVMGRFMDGDAVRFFDRRVEGVTLTFSVSSGGVVTDDQTGSVWNGEGEAVSGEYRGVRLTQVVSMRSFAFAALAMYPQAEVIGAVTGEAAAEADVPAEPIEINVE